MVRQTVPLPICWHSFGLDSLNIAGYSRYSEQNHRPTAATKIPGNHGELILPRCFGARPVGSAKALRSFVPEQNHRPTLTSGGLITQAPRTQRQIHGNRDELILTPCFGARPMGSAKALTRGGLITQAP